MRALVRTLAALLAAVAATGCADTSHPDPTPTPTTAATATAPAVEQTTPAGQAPAAVEPGERLVDRIYYVGSEVKPGTYATTVPAGLNCYWARLRDFGRPGAIIDQANLEPGEQVRVTVLPSDRGFKVSGGCVWTSIVAG